MKNLEKDIERILKLTSQVNMDKMNRKELVQMHRIMRFLETAIDVMDECASKRAVAAKMKRRKKRKTVSGKEQNIRKDFGTHKILITFANSKAKKLKEKKLK